MPGSRGRTSSFWPSLRPTDTRALIGEAEFRLMRRTAVLVNVARGGLVDEKALERAITDGAIAGAGLDAFVREPLAPESPLWRLPERADHAALGLLPAATTGRR